MVTTNSGNDTGAQFSIPGCDKDIDFLVRHLENSEIPGDQEIAQLAIKRVNEIIRMIKPVLLYIDRDLGDGLRGIPLWESEENRSHNTKPESPILGRGGNWFKWNGKEFKFDDSWKDCSFSLIMTALAAIFAMATSRKEEQIRKVATRRDRLELIGKIARGESIEK